MEPDSVLLLGVGNVGVSVAKRYTGKKKILGTTRNKTKADSLRALGIEPLLISSPPTEEDAQRISTLAHGQFVVASFPPELGTDELLADACKFAKSIVYVSATSVYGAMSGVIDATTPVDENDEHAQSRLRAEKIWNSVRAMIVRAPGIYGPTSGLHLRLKQGTYSLPEDGTRYVSRIHVDDLAAIIEAALNKGEDGKIYLVGDSVPTTHLEAVQWLCKQMNLPLPGSTPLSAVSYTLRGNRHISGDKALKDLGVKLQYPSYKEGFLQCLQSMDRASTKS